MYLQRHTYCWCRLRPIQKIGYPILRQLLNNFLQLLKICKLRLFLNKEMSSGNKDLLSDFFRFLNYQYEPVTAHF